MNLALDQSANVLQLGGGTAGTLTLSGASKALGLIFTGVDGNILSTSATSTNTLTLLGSGITANNSATLSGSAATILGAAQTWTVATGKTFSVSTAVNNATYGLSIAGAGDTVISGVIGNGSGGLTKTGAGILTLSATNTYTGGTTVSGGTLVFSSGSLGSTGSITMSGGALQWATGNTQDLSSRVVMTAGNLAVFFTNGNNISFSTGIGGSTTASLLKHNAGTLTLSATNTYTGGTYVYGGTLALGHATNTLADAGAVTVAYGATLDIGANSDTVGAVTLSSGSITGTTGTLTGSSYLVNNASTDAASISAKLGGTAALTMSGAGTLTLTGANTYTGGTTVSAGTLTLGHATNTLADTGAVTVSGGTLDIGANSDTVGAVTLSSGSITGTTGTLTGSSYSVTNAVGTTAISAKLGGTGVLTKTGVGQLTLSGANTYTGSTTVSAGTLLASSAASLPGYGTSGKVVVAGGATLAVAAGAWTSANIDTLRANATWSSATTSVLGVDTTSGDFTYGSAITTGALTKLGANTLTLTGANTYTGGTTLSTGTLSFASGSLGSSGAITMNGGALQWASGNTQDVSARLTMVSGKAATLDTNGNTVFLATAFGGSTSGSLVKAGSGGLVLTGANNYTGGTTVSAGTLAFASGSLGSTGAITLAGGALQWWTGNTQDISSRLSLANGASVTLYTGGNNVAFATGIGSSTGGLTKDDTGTLTLSGSNGYTGGTAVFAGTLVLGHASNALSDVGQVWIRGGTLDIGANSDTVGGVYLDSGSITGTSGTLTAAYYVVNTATVSDYASSSAKLAGSGSLTKSGDGWLTLTGVNTYSGGTRISAGVLSFANGSLGSLSSPSGILMDGGTLQWGSGNTQDISSRLLIADGKTSTLSVAYGDIVLTNGFGGSSTGSVIKSGPSALTLLGTTTYTGGTTITNGTLVLGHATNTLADTGAVNVSGGTLDIGANSDTVGAVTLSGGSITGTTGTLTGSSYAVTAAVGAAISAKLSGAGSLSVSGGGTLTLSGVNAYVGGTAISGGSTVSFAQGSLSSSGAITISSGTLRWASGNAEDISSRIVLQDGGVAYLDTNGNNVTLVSSLGGATSSALVKSGSGTLTLSGSNTYTGGTYVYGGTLTLGHATNTLADSGALTVWNGGILDIGANSDTVGAVTLLSYGWIIGTTGVLSASSFSSTSGGLISAKLAGAGALAVSGATTPLTLTAVNAYTGGTTISGGSTLEFANGSLGSSGTITLDGSTLRWLSGNTQDVSTRLVMVSGKSATIDTNGNNVVFAGGFGGATTGSLVKAGTGALTLSGSNTYTGGTTISAGTLVLGHATNTLADTGAVTVNGGTLDIGANSDTVGAVTLSSGWITGTTGTLRGSSYSVTNTTSTTVIWAKLGGAGALTKTGAGSLVLAGSNAYTGGTTILAGTLILGQAMNTLADTGAVTISGGTLDIGANSDTVGAVTLSSGSITGTTGMLSASSFSISSGGVISVKLAGAGTLAVSGGSTLTLSATNAYTGGTTISGGSTVSFSSGSLGSGGNITLDGATLQWISGNSQDVSSRLAMVSGKVATIDTNGNNVVFAGGFGGLTTGSLVKAGTGTLTLSGANTYTGGTTISAGTLLASLPASLPGYGTSGKVAVSSGATLAVAAGAWTSANIDTLRANATWSSATTSVLGLDTSAGNFTYGSAITTGAFAKLGGNTLTLTGTSTYLGGTTVYAGTLALGHATNTLADAGAVTVSGGTLDIGANSDTVGAVTLSSGAITGTTGTLTGSSYSATNSGDISITAKLGGTAVLTASGSGALTISGANTYTGGTVISGGGTVSFVSGSLGSSGAITLSSGLLKWAAGNTQDISSRLVLLNGGSAGLDTNGNGVTLATAFGSLSSSSLTKAGAGTLRLSAANTYTGGTTISAGTLALGHATNTLADTGAVTISGGTLDIGANSDTVGAVTLSSGSITGTTGALTASSYYLGSGSFGVIAVKLAGTGGLTNYGSMTLSASNAYTGGTTVSGGALVLGHATNTLVDTGAVTVSGGILDIGANSDTVGAVTLSGGSIRGTSGVLTATSYSITNSYYEVSISAKLGGAAALSVSGGNVATLFSSNAYTGGTTVSAGTLVLGHATNTLADTGAVTISGGILDIGANSDTVGAVTLSAGSITGTTGTLTGSSYSATNVADATISAQLAGAGALTKTGAGKLTLSGSNSYTGGTTVSGGRCSRPRPPRCPAMARPARWWWRVVRPWRSPRGPGPRPTSTRSARTRPGRAPRPRCWASTPRRVTFLTAAPSRRAR